MHISKVIIETVNVSVWNSQEYQSWKWKALSVAKKIMKKGLIRWSNYLAKIWSKIIILKSNTFCGLRPLSHCIERLLMKGCRPVKGQQSLIKLCERIKRANPRIVTGKVITTAWSEMFLTVGCTEECSW